jgi:hypothetical protein
VSRPVPIPVLRRKQGHRTSMAFRHSIQQRRARKGKGHDRSPVNRPPDLLPEAWPFWFGGVHPRVTKPDTPLL